MFYIFLKGVLLYRSIIIKLSDAIYYIIIIMSPRISIHIMKSRITIFKGNNISNTNEGIVTETKVTHVDWKFDMGGVRIEQNWGKTVSIKINRNSVVGKNNVILIKLAYKPHSSVIYLHKYIIILHNCELTAMICYEIFSQNLIIIRFNKFGHVTAYNKIIIDDCACIKLLN